VITAVEPQIYVSSVYRYHLPCLFPFHDFVEVKKKMDQRFLEEEESRERKFSLTLF